MSTRIYIAGPYSSGDTAMNVRNALEAAECLRDMGYAPYIPHLTHFWHLVFPHDIDYWYALDNEWLAACDCLVRLPGQSHGADMEVGLAAKLNIPVYFGLENVPPSGPS